MGKTKRVADGEETTIVIPPIVVVVQVDIALRIVPVQIRHVAITIAIHPHRNA